MARLTKDAATEPRTYKISNRKIFSLVAAILLVIGAGFLTGCGDKFSEPFKDAPRSHQDSGNPTDVVRFADGFSNVGTSCDEHGNRVYVAYHGDSPYAAIFVLEDAKDC